MVGYLLDTFSNRIQAELKNNTTGYNREAERAVMFLPLDAQGGKDERIFCE